MYTDSPIFKDPSQDPGKHSCWTSDQSLPWLVENSTETTPSLDPPQSVFSSNWTNAAISDGSHGNKESSSMAQTLRLRPRCSSWRRQNCVRLLLAEGGMFMDTRRGFCRYKRGDHKWQIWYNLCKKFPWWNFLNRLHHGMIYHDNLPCTQDEIKFADIYADHQQQMHTQKRRSLRSLPGHMFHHLGYEKKSEQVQTMNGRISITFCFVLKGKTVNKD